MRLCGNHAGIFVLNKIYPVRADEYNLPVNMPQHFNSNYISVVSLNENLSAVKLVENISSNISFIINNSFDPIKRVEKHLKSWIHAHSYRVLFCEKDILECAFHSNSCGTGIYSMPLVAYGGYSWLVDEFSGSDVNLLRPRGNRKCK